MLGIIRTAGRFVTGTLPPSEFGLSDPPDWVVRADVSFLPNGGSRAYTLLVFSQRATLEVRSARWVWSRWAVRERTEFGADDTNSLTELLNRATSERRPRPKGFVYDGAPCRLVAYRRQPFQVLRLRGNLWAGFRTVGATGQAPALAELAIGLAFRQTAEPEPKVNITADPPQQ
jgi:hypothetical protein